jgi:hypothetical protein
MKRTLIIALCLLNICGISQAQMIKIVKLTDKKTKTNEPSIFLDPVDNKYVLAGTNNDNVFTSDRTGIVWEENKLESSYGVKGDPVVYITNEGLYYYCHLSKTEGKEKYDVHDRIVMQRSDDRGETWNDGTAIGFVEGKMQDKPWFVVDERKKSEYNGSIYLAWTEFDKYNSPAKTDSTRIKFAFSRDSGKTFSKPIVISDTFGNCLDDDQTLEGATCAIGKNGDVYVVWAGHGNLYFDKSTNGGDSFGTDKIIGKQLSGWNQDVSHVMRTNGMPFLATNSKGHLFVVYGDTIHGDHDIFLITSKDQGETWSEPIRVNNDKIGNGKEQYLPHMFIDPSDDKVYIVYYDRRLSENNLFLDIFIASTSDGKKIKNHRVTNRSFPPAGKRHFFGDYIGVAASNGEIRPIWTDTEEGYITVKVGLFNKDILKNSDLSDKDEYITYYQDVKKGKLYLHMNIKDNNGFNIEIMNRGNKVFESHHKDRKKGGEFELELSTKSLPKGWSELIISYGGFKMKKKLMVF